MNKEQKTQHAICDYLRMQYPSVMYMVSPSGIKLTHGQAMNLKRNQHPSKGWPDLLIFKPKGMYNGLLLEIKADGVTIYKKDGLLKANEHVAIQQAMHGRLVSENYCARFACGFDEAKTIIDKYMNL